MEVARLVHELQVHQIELEMQNEELRQARASADALLAQYTDLYEFAPVGYLTLDREGAIRQVNLIGARLLGSERSELVKRRFGLFVAETDRRVFSDFLEKVFACETKESCEVTLSREGLQPLVVQIEGTRSADGQECHTVVQDITGRKKKEDELSSSKAFLNSVIELSPESIWVSNSEGTMIRINQACRELFGVTEEEAVGKYNLFKDNLIEEQGLMPLVEDVFRKGEIARFTIDYDLPRVEHVKARGATHRILDVVISPIKDMSGKVTNAIIQHKDITERKQAEDALKASESRFLDLLYASHDAILLIDGEMFVDCNEATAKMLGYTSRNQILMSHPSKLSPPTQPDGRNSIEKANEMMRIAFQTGYHRFEWMHRKANGEDFPVEVSLTPMRLEGKTVLHCLWRDMTRHKELEAQLRESQKMEAVGQLAGGISHDFNNLLSVISGYSQMLLLEPNLKENTRSNIEEILRAGERASGLTRQLLIFSRRQPMEARIIDLDTIISGMEKMLRRLIRENIIVNRKIGPALWQIKADSGNIEQVIMNLAINASDAMQDGGTLTVETENVKIDKANRLVHHSDIKPGHYVMLSVSDTGCGMDDKVRGRIFEPFFTTKEVGKGTGLGLSTVYGVVKQSNGLIDVQSEPGNGTMFRIYFPQVVAECAANEKQQEEKEEEVIILRGGETILLAEDKDSLRMMLQEFLHSLGYTILPACNGKAALELAEKHKGKIHLLLTDVIMPGMTGFELSKNIKKLLPDIKLLFMSGYTNLPDSQTMVGISDKFIQKPLNLHSLSVKLREILGK